MYAIEIRFIRSSCEDVINQDLKFLRSSHKNNCINAFFTPVLHFLLHCVNVKLVNGS